MPLVRVTMTKGKSPEYIKKMSDSIYEALVEAYQMSENDLFQIVERLEPGDLIYDRRHGIKGQRSDDFMIINIESDARRRVEKEAFLARLSDKLAASPGIARDDVFVRLSMSSGAEDWSFGSGIPCCEQSPFEIERQVMSSCTHETVPTQFLDADGIRYAYRRFGKVGTVPLLFLGYFNSNMDGWDPEVTNSLATEHELILFDNAGVGASGGETPSTVREMTEQCFAFCRTLGLTAIHVVGFSLGGMIAQQLAGEHPDLVRRLILLGTGPRGGEGLTFTELSAEEQKDPVAFLLGAFFSPSQASQAAGREYMKRLESRRQDRDLPVSRNSAEAQLAAIREWGTIPASGRYAYLDKITHPTLIVHGNKDVVVGPTNALILAEHLPNAQLIVYSDSSHGTMYQHARVFLEHVKLFLSDGDFPVAELDPTPVELQALA